MTFQTKLQDMLHDCTPEIIKIRRYLHEHPEPSFHEKKTAQFIAHYYQRLGWPTRHCGTGYGLVADLNPEKTGKKLALRADFDALPLQEDNDLVFKSGTPGAMHACGHDGHTASLLVLAKCLLKLKDEIPGSIRFIHQPAEELSPGGALSMVKDGAMNGVDHVVGLHVMSTMPTGRVELHAGPTQTGRANFDLKITGKGGHASMPQLSNDAIVAGSYLVTALQTIVSRRLDPFAAASVTISSFDGASASYNAIQKEVKLKGDVRMMTEANRKRLKELIVKTVKGTEAAFNVKAELNYDDNYPVLVNDIAFTKRVKNWLQETDLPGLTGVKDSGYVNASEDFSYFAQKAPGCFFYVGCHPKQKGNFPHHSPNFMMNEKCLPLCAEAMGCVIGHYFGLV